MLSNILPPEMSQPPAQPERREPQAKPCHVRYHAPDQLLDQAFNQAQDIARRVERKGYCLVYLEVVGDVVAFARDDAVDKVPPGYVVYTRSELVELYGGADSPPISTFGLLHEAKKLGGWVVGRASRRSQGGSDGR